MKHIPSTSSVNLDDYLEREKVGNDLPRVLYTWGQHCRSETAKSEFRSLRQQHGAQGAVRRVPATYVEPSDPADATHFRVGKNWRAAKSGETATHVRIEPDEPFVKRAEAIHFIWSYDLATVNPQDPEQTKRAFDAVQAFVEQDYAGVQMKLVAHGDARGSKKAIERGENGKFHVHGMANAIVHTTMEVDGRTFRSGARMAGPLTHVDRMRERWDDFLATRGHEFGLGPQDRNILPAPRSVEARAVRRTNQDFWSSERGKVSDQDRARRGLETAMSRLAETPQALAGLDANALLLQLAAAAQATGDVELVLRRTSKGELKVRSFLVPGRKQPIGSTRLGERYGNKTATASGLLGQLELISRQQWQPLPSRSARPPRPVLELDADELEQLRREVEALAQRELEQQATERRVTTPQGPAQPVAAVATPRPTTPSIVEAASQTSDLSAYHRDYPQEMKVLHDLFADHCRQQYPGVTPDMIEVLAAGRLNDRAVNNTLTADLQDIRDELERAKPQTPAPAPAPRTDPEPTVLPGQHTSSAPGSGAAALSPKARKTRSEFALRTLTEDQKRSAELIAVVRKEREDGGAYVDFQLAASEPGARGQAGLHLKATRGTVSKDGIERQVTRTWMQLSAEQYRRLRIAAGDNFVDVEGHRVYGVAADITPSLTERHAPNLKTLQSSRLAPLTPDVMQKQRASEDRVRERRQRRDDELRTAPLLAAQRSERIEDFEQVPT